MTIQVGYQGIKGSNSEEAAKRLMDKFNIHDYQLVALVSSYNVFSQLLTNKIDYAVVATKNNISGFVTETYQAINDVHVELVSKEILPIRHGIYSKNKSVQPMDITKIISHEQAIKQCQHNILKFFPTAAVEAVENTAVGAKYLYESKYNQQTAVICSSSAAKTYHLHLLFDSFQDSTHNKTEFSLYQDTKTFQTLR